MEKIIKVEVIEKFMKENGYSKTRFARACKVSPTTFNEVLLGKIKITPLTKIARVMRVSLFDLIG